MAEYRVLVVLVALCPTGWAAEEPRPRPPRITIGQPGSQPNPFDLINLIDLDAQKFNGSKLMRDVGRVLLSSIFPELNEEKQSPTPIPQPTSRAAFATNNAVDNLSARQLQAFQQPLVAPVAPSKRALSAPSFDAFPSSLAGAPGLQNTLFSSGLSGRTDLPANYIYPFASAGDIVQPDHGSARPFFLGPDGLQEFNNLRQRLLGGRGEHSQSAVPNLPPPRNNVAFQSAAPALVANRFTPDAPQSNSIGRGVDEFEQSELLVDYYEPEDMQLTTAIRQQEQLQQHIQQSRASQFTQEDAEKMQREYAETLVRMQQLLAERTRTPATIRKGPSTPDSDAYANMILRQLQNDRLDRELPIPPYAEIPASQPLVNLAPEATAEPKTSAYQLALDRHKHLVDAFQPTSHAPELDVLPSAPTSFVHDLQLQPDFDPVAQPATSSGAPPPKPTVPMFDALPVTTAASPLLPRHQQPDFELVPEDEAAEDGSRRRRQMQLLHDIQAIAERQASLEPRETHWQTEQAAAAVVQLDARPGTDEETMTWQRAIQPAPPAIVGNHKTIQPREAETTPRPTTSTTVAAGSSTKQLPAQDSLHRADFVQQVHREQTDLLQPCPQCITFDWNKLRGSWTQMYGNPGSLRTIYSTLMSLQQLEALDQPMLTADIVPIQPSCVGLQFVDKRPANSSILAANLFFRDDSSTRKLHELNGEVNSASEPTNRTLSLQFPALDLPMCVLGVGGWSAAGAYEYVVLTETNGNNRCRPMHVFARHAATFFDKHNRQMIHWMAQGVQSGQRLPVSPLPFPDLCQLPGHNRFRGATRLRYTQ